MKIAVVYNRDSKSVINLFGLPNREKIGLKTIERLVKGLRAGGHEVIALEGDKDLLSRLEDFMPRVVHGERPGMVFNVSYGIQGQARYTHVPSILEMAGIPYVASGPLGHSLSLDKVVTKMILRQTGLPTPDFAVLENPDELIPELNYPVIVKPKNEAVSFGLKVVHDEASLREAAGVIFDEFGQAVLAEQFIEGREVNVGLLGNNPPEAFPPVELNFGTDGPQIYTYEDKTGKSGRKIEPICPALIGEEKTQEVQQLAIRAFRALGLCDCARVDTRMDRDGRFYILETNSLPSLGEHGSYLVGAAQVGLDFVGFVNRLVEVASARYFGTPSPTIVRPKPKDLNEHVLSFVTQRRKEMERRVRDWVHLSSRTSDPVGLQQAGTRISTVLQDIGLKPVSEFTDAPEIMTWETPAGLAGGTLLIANLDVPMDPTAAPQAFRRAPEGLYGEGVGTTRSPLVMLEYALRALRSARRLRRLPLGVLLYTDEGREARDSAAQLAAAAANAKQVLVLNPGIPPEGIIVLRQGNRRLRLSVHGKPALPGRGSGDHGTLRWVWSKLERFAALQTPRSRCAISVLHVSTERHPMRLPHRVTATILLTYHRREQAERMEQEMRDELGRRGPKWELVAESDRPPMVESSVNKALVEQFERLAAEREITLKRDSSIWASVAGLVPPEVPCICGVGPVARDRGTPEEHVLRISLVSRTLLLAQFLAAQLPQDS